MPDKFLLYKTALNLSKLMKCTNYTIEWAALNFNTDFDFKTNKLYCQKGKH